MKRTVYIFFLLLIPVVSVFSQTVKVKGQLVDGQDGSALIGAAVVLMQASDTTKFKGTTVDTSGNFSFDAEPGIYKLKAELISYNDLTLRITVANLPVNLGKLTMRPSATILKETVVEAKQIRVEQKGDTTQYHADAYKVNKDATTEDLVNKMPGVTTQGGNVTVNGEQVKQILVDGKPFFGDDPNLAIKNLPAEIVDKIQVFDKLSDQAQFTGVDDGNSQKTINIITKSGKNNGQFGKIYGGYGVDAKGQGVSDKYIGGGNINLFKGDRRFSIIGLSNNINQQNFS
ncbi:MAG TPA: carboxypeptidase-like regulatory domain-containing protein, partial [Bacteroidia bacterium]|nr:carboxypeptidase-like regulatory domain-containing protein [Bacteroidia bacterium]